ncbi:hypothetical protein KZ829_35415 [Actinoplanes hulinensis]|uniref:Uncharacterized protein n=1 Tax=Actinoplanes hulinensis TaxID=1144547 RepID=A0ABS7BDN7_9ACTN|nr:hypothetical protein [Actinoplanes hulinensis]MBW6439032.1 hypothetical protein [Actinoplanes hulinensis]
MVIALVVSGVVVIALFARQSGDRNSPARRTGPVLRGHPVGAQHRRRAEILPRRFNEQADRYPGFAGYAEKTAGICTIPVLELTRLRPDV